ncbi:Acyl-CoA dehydrogenase [Parapedobacter koreensis]|uniref:Acyl-CoA dehydrogenase n=2 Tax=Parapedobacter koreensis TaxID=332977 RepID=A0A1H7M7Z9_9SPHI|nr:Acyl-CoA dehydrogenase [Parapedobacter koreensis]
MMAAEVAALLGDLSGQAEVDGRLTPEQLAIIYDRRWFKLFVPKCYGGLELTVPEGVRLEEELAQIDGSLGWTVTLCAGANLFVGYIEQSVAATLFTEPMVCLGGSGHASGKAVVENGGFRVSGTWRYATGAPHLTHFTANCILERHGETWVDEEGNPIIKSFFFAKEDVRVVEDWNTLGLKATASHSFEVDNVWVANTHAFIIAPEQATLAHPIYHYPFLQFAEATLAANTLGMARHFVACTAAQGKAALYDLAETAQQQIMQVKESFYRAVDASWDELLSIGSISPETLLAVSNQSRVLAHVCREQVMALYPHAGLAAADTATEINRVWRDIFTASQHSLLR